MLPLLDTSKNSSLSVTSGNSDTVIQGSNVVLMSGKNRISLIVKPNVDGKISITTDTNYLTRNGFNNRMVAANQDIEITFNRVSVTSSLGQIVLTFTPSDSSIKPITKTYNVKYGS